MFLNYSMCVGGTPQSLQLLHTGPPSLVASFRPGASRHRLGAKQKLGGFSIKFSNALIKRLVEKLKYYNSWRSVGKVPSRWRTTGPGGTHSANFSISSYSNNSAF